MKIPRSTQKGLRFTYKGKEYEYRSILDERFITCRVVGLLSKKWIPYVPDGEKHIIIEGAEIIND